MSRHPAIPATHRDVTRIPSCVRRARVRKRASSNRVIDEAHIAETDAVLRGTTRRARPAHHANRSLVLISQSSLEAPHSHRDARPTLPSKRHWPPERSVAEDDAVVNCVADERRHRRRRQFLREMLAVRSHRSETHAEIGGDLLTRHSLRDARQHFAFTFGERCRFAQWFAARHEHGFEGQSDVMSGRNRNRWCTRVGIDICQPRTNFRQKQSGLVRSRSIETTDAITRYE